MAKKNDTIQLNDMQKTKVIEELKGYIQENFYDEISDFQTGIFLDFLSEKIAPYYYNKAIADAMSFMEDKVGDMYLIMKDEE